MKASPCPCCSTSLLHHLDNDREYWFCRHCWAEMPNLEMLTETKRQNLAKIVDLSTSSVKFNHPALVSYTISHH